MRDDDDKMRGVLNFSLRALNLARAQHHMDPLDELPTPSRPGTHRCTRCDVPMPTNVWACPPCREKEAAALQAEVIGPLRAKALASIPDVFRDLTRENPELARRCPEDARRRAFEYAKGNVLILGPTGAGKSSLAAAMMLHAIDATKYGCTCRWVSAQGVVAAMTEHEYGDGPPPLVARALRAKLLVVDDIGSERSNGTNQGLHQIVWERYNNGLTTVYTSGFSPAKLLERYGDAFYRRLHDNGRIIVIK